MFLWITPSSSFLSLQQPYKVCWAEKTIGLLNAFPCEVQMQALFGYKLLMGREETQAAAFSNGHGVPVPCLISSPGVCVQHMCDAASIPVRSVPCCLQSHFGEDGKICGKRVTGRSPLDFCC